MKPYPDYTLKANWDDGGKKRLNKKETEGGDSVMISEGHLCQQMALGGNKEGYIPQTGLLSAGIKSKADISLTIVMTFLFFITYCSLI